MIGQPWLCNISVFSLEANLFIFAIYKLSAKIYFRLIIILK